MAVTHSTLLFLFSDGCSLHILHVLLRIDLQLPRGQARPGWSFPANANSPVKLARCVSEPQQVPSHLLCFDSSLFALSSFHRLPKALSHIFFLELLPSVTLSCFPPCSYPPSTTTTVAAISRLPEIPPLLLSLVDIYLFLSFFFSICGSSVSSASSVVVLFHRTWPFSPTQSPLSVYSIISLCYFLLVLGPILLVYGTNLTASSCLSPSTELSFFLSLLLSCHTSFPSATLLFVLSCLAHPSLYLLSTYPFFLSLSLPLPPQEAHSYFWLFTSLRSLSIYRVPSLLPLAPSLPCRLVSQLRDPLSVFEACPLSAVRALREFCSIITYCLSNGTRKNLHYEEKIPTPWAWLRKDAFLTSTLFFFS